MEFRTIFCCDVLSKLEDDYLFIAKTVLLTKPLPTLTMPIMEKGSSYDMLSQQTEGLPPKFLIV
jgi:hypothetical protein